MGDRILFLSTKLRIFVEISKCFYENYVEISKFSFLNQSMFLPYLYHIYFSKCSLTGSSVFPIWKPTANNTKWAQNAVPIYLKVPD